MFGHLRIVSKTKNCITDFGYVFLPAPSHSAADEAISGRVKQAQMMLQPNYDETYLALTSKRCDLLADDSLSH